MAEARPPLVTERLILRDFEPDDWRALYAAESDPETVRHLPREPLTEPQSRDYIAYCLERARLKPRRLFELAVVLRDEGLVIGRCGLLASEAEDASFWYVLDAGRRGAGLMSEAVTALIDFGFGDLGLRRLWADIDPRNHASVRVAERLGLRREAHFQENVLIKGEWCGTLIYAILNREWTAARSSG